MKKKYVLIFAKTKYSKTPYDQWLAGSGIEPIILTTEEFAPGYQSLPQVYAFGNYDHNSQVEKKAFEIARTLPLVGVFARAEADIIRAAQLREMMALPGQKTLSALAYRNKVIMKNHLRDSGVFLPHYCPLDSTYTAMQFIEMHGYPVVIKPYAESGSFGTCIIHNEAELDDYLYNTQINNNAEIETFVDGQMYHVDGLIINHQIVFVQPSQYINNCLSFRENKFLGSSTIAPLNPIYQPLIDATHKVLAKLPTPQHMAFHAELWRQEDGKIVFCEIASRTGGSMISETIKHCFNLNIDQEWLYAECGLARSIEPAVYNPCGWIGIPPLDGVLEHIPFNEEPDCVLTAEYCGMPGQRFHGGVKSGLFLAGYVVNGESESEVSKNILNVANWFASQTKWRLAAQ